MTPYLKRCFIVFLHIFLVLHDSPISGLHSVSHCRPSAASQPIWLSTTPGNITQRQQKALRQMGLLLMLPSCLFQGWLTAVTQRHLGRLDPNSKGGCRFPQFLPGPGGQWEGVTVGVFCSLLLPLWPLNHKKTQQSSVNLLRDTKLWLSVAYNIVEWKNTKPNEYVQN